MRTLQLKPKEWICLLHIQSIRRYHYRTASLKMAFQVRLVSEVRRLEWALLVCTSLECYCPRFDWRWKPFSIKKRKEKRLKLPLPIILGWCWCFEIQMKWVVNSDVCIVRLALADNGHWEFLCCETILSFFSVHVMIFVLRNIILFSFFPSTSLVEKK